MNEIEINRSKIVLFYDLKLPQIDKKGINLLESS